MIVNFGTAQPIGFQEKKLYLTLEARFYGKAEVSEYDRTKYPTEEDLVYAIRSNIKPIAEDCFKNWPSETVMTSKKEEILCAWFESDFARMGIQATFKVEKFELTGESMEEFLEAGGLEKLGYTRVDSFGEMEPAGQPKPEDLTPEEHGPVIEIYSSFSSHGMAANSATSGKEVVRWQEDGSVIIESVDCRFGTQTYEKYIAGSEAAKALREFIRDNHIAEMAQVETIPMSASMRPMDCSSGSSITFTFNDGGNKVERRLDCGSCWKVQEDAIRKIRELIRNCITSGECLEKKESYYDPYKAPYMGKENSFLDFIKQPGAWKCSCGFEENTGRFCMNCGEPKPAGKWKCSKCNTENSGKFCENCGTKRPE